MINIVNWLIFFGWIKCWICDSGWWLIIKLCFYWFFGKFELVYILFNIFWIFFVNVELGIIVLIVMWLLIVNFDRFFVKERFIDLVIEYWGIFFEGIIVFLFVIKIMCLKFWVNIVGK